MADGSAPSGGRSAAPWIAVCQKWVATRPEVDPLTGIVESDVRWSGPSLADQAALEWGLRLAERCGGQVVVVTVGIDAADAMLRDAVAVGAARAVHVRIAEHEQPTSAAVARAIGDVLRSIGPAMVVCGDWSLDRGSASVPPFLAAELGMGQACGLVGLDVRGQPDIDAQGRRDPAGFSGDRRLDGGRREQIAIDGPTVMSVEGAAAALRRAPLSRVLAAASVPRKACRPSLALLGRNLVGWRSVPRPVMGS